MKPAFVINASAKSSKEEYVAQGKKREEAIAKLMDQVMEHPAGAQKDSKKC